MVCTFEKSPLREHTGKRIVVMRVQRLLSPMRIVPYDGSHGAVLFDPQILSDLVPKEGELIRRLARGKVAPWAVDVDSDRLNFARALKILFDNELAAQSR